jgi:hypothetical protein
MRSDALWLATASAVLVANVAFAAPARGCQNARPEFVNVEIDDAYSNWMFPIFLTRRSPL